MKHFKINAWQETKDYALIMIGLLCYALGVTIFLIPYEVTTGGVAGISSLIYFATGIKVQYSYLVINSILLIAAIKVLGFKFCVKSIYAIIALTLLLAGFQELIADEQGNLPRIVGDQAFMAAIIGGALEGFGLAIVFLNNGSTGGTDIIAAIVNKYRDISLGRVIMICDIFIISSSYLVVHDWEKVLYGYVVLCVQAFCIDQVVNSRRRSVQFFIISQKYEEIGKRINVDADRGVTVVNASGFYSGQDVKMLFVLAKQRQAPAIFRLISEIDPNAFVSQSAVIGVYGEGFDKIKYKAKKEHGV